MGSFIAADPFPAELRAPLAAEEGSSVGADRRERSATFHLLSGSTGHEPRTTWAAGW